MRKLIFGTNLTLDGCCDHTKGIADEALHDYFTSLLKGCDTFVYGRKTYELMVPFWPDMARKKSGDTKALNDFAETFSSVKQIVVFSRTLTKVDEKSAILNKGDLREEILKLKQQEGKSIMTGGVDIPNQLIQMDLVDEFYFVIHPVFAGEGRRLLENINLNREVRLESAKHFGAGHVALHYSRKTV